MPSISLVGTGMVHMEEWGTRVLSNGVVLETIIHRVSLPHTGLASVPVDGGKGLTLGQSASALAIDLLYDNTPGWGMFSRIANVLLVVGIQYNKRHLLSLCVKPCG